MGPDLTSLPRTTSCPACGAALRPEATWCSLCFFDFRPASAPVAAELDVPVQMPSYDGADPLTAPLLDLLLPAAPPAATPAPREPEPAGAPAAPTAGVWAEPTWPCARCGDANPLSSTACGTCGAGFLAAVAETPSLVLPLVGDLHKMSRGKRAAVAGAVVGLVVVPLAALTLLLTPTPRPAGTSPAGSSSGSSTTDPSGTTTYPTTP